MAKIVTDSYDIDISALSKKMGLTIAQQKTLQKELTSVQKEMKTTEKTGKKSFSNLAIGVNQSIEVFGKLYNKIKETAKSVLEFDKNTTLIEKRFDTTRGEAEKLNAELSAMATTFEVDINTEIDATNVLMKEFGISSEKAFNLLSKSANKVPDKFNEILENVTEYSSQFSQIGITAEHFLAISTQAIQKGVFSDKGVDTIKEFNLAIREMTPAANDALKAIGMSGAEITKQIETGQSTIFEIMTEVSKKTKETGINSKETGMVLADLFKGAGEDAGRFVLNLGDLEDSLGNVEDQISESQKTQLEANKAYAESEAILNKNLLPALTSMNSILNELAIFASGGGVGVLEFLQKSSKGLSQILNKSLMKDFQDSQRLLIEQQIKFAKETGITWDEYQTNLKNGTTLQDKLNKSTDDFEKILNNLDKTDIELADKETLQQVDSLVKSLDKVFIEIYRNSEAFENLDGKSKEYYKRIIDEAAKYKEETILENEALNEKIEIQDKLAEKELGNIDLRNEDHELKKEQELELIDLSKEKEEIEEYSHELEKKRIKEKEDLNKKRIKGEQLANSAILGSYINLFGAIGKENKAFFVLAQALKIAEAIMNGSVGNTKIAAEWAWNPPVATTLLTANNINTGVAVGTIAAQTIGEFKDGVVNLQGAGTGTSDSIPARLSKGESVATAAATSAGQNAQLITSMNGGQSFSDSTSLLSEMNNNIMGLGAIIAGQENVIIVNNEVTQDGLTSTVQKGSNEFDVNNNKIELESSI